MTVADYWTKLHKRLKPEVAALAYFTRQDYYQTMELGYTYFEAEDGFFVGWFDDFPEDVTQGKTLEELEEMLADIYDCLNLAKYHKRKLVLA